MSPPNLTQPNYQSTFYAERQENKIVLSLQPVAHKLHTRRTHPEIQRLPSPSGATTEQMSFPFPSSSISFATDELTLQSNSELYTYTHTNAQAHDDAPIPERR